MTFSLITHYVNRVFFRCELIRNNVFIQGGSGMQPNGGVELGSEGCVSVIFNSMVVLS